MNSNEQIIEDLVSKLLADNLSPSEREELNCLLQSDSEARQVYHDRMWMETGLREYHAGGTSVVVPSASRIPILPRLASNWPAISALAALLVLAVGALWIVNSDGDDDNSTVAWLEYRDKMHIDGVDVGLPLREQTLRFEDGQAVIRFLSGARLMFSGPGEIGITGPNSATLTEGSVTVRVDEGGEGFQLKTPNGLITDLGTQFGVHVSNGEDRVHVIAGKITVERDGVIQELSKGQAVNSQGNVEFFRPEFFPEIGSTRELTKKNNLAG